MLFVEYFDLIKLHFIRFAFVYEVKEQGFGSINAFHFKTKGFMSFIFVKLKLECLRVSPFMSGSININFNLGGITVRLVVCTFKAQLTEMLRL